VRHSHVRFGIFRIRSEVDGVLGIIDLRHVNGQQTFLFKEFPVELFEPAVVLYIENTAFHGSVAFVDIGVQ